jgi:tRNA(Leu) C34 or U34 (ribose-2'-O)-methylase TrmL
MRGFACIGLDQPKNMINIGGIMRAAGNYRVRMIALGGDRYKRQASDTMATWRHTPVLQVADVLGAIPFDCVPVAVDLIPGATPLPAYQHPERAFYIFGAEDQTLGRRITERCRDVVYVPTNRCMNLAVAVATILYDRMVKRGEWADVMTSMAAE